MDYVDAPKINTLPSFAPGKLIQRPRDRRDLPTSLLAFFEIYHATDPSSNENATPIREMASKQKTPKPTLQEGRWRSELKTSEPNRRFLSYWHDESLT